MNDPGTDLRVIIPAFDEEDVLEATLADWCSILGRLEIDFEIHLFDDGSRDGTAAIADRWAAQEVRVRVHHQPNQGHGPTILGGYREAVASSRWIFQADADSEIPPSAFEGVWAARQDCDLILGTRSRRGSPTRAAVSLVARIVVAALFGRLRVVEEGQSRWRLLRDVNSPFRLFRASTLRTLLEAVPERSFAPNVALSGLALRHKLGILEVPVPFTGRGGGLSGRRLWRAAGQTALETLRVAWSSRGAGSWRRQDGS